VERKSPEDVAFTGTVELAEVTGSLTFIHLELTTGDYVVIEVDGAHTVNPDEAVTGYFHPKHLYGFDADTGVALFATTKVSG
jgi:glycerol transport system ATP-binding protein